VLDAGGSEIQEGTREPLCTLATHARGPSHRCPGACVGAGRLGEGRDPRPGMGAAATADTPLVSGCASAVPVAGSALAESMQGDIEGYVADFVRNNRVALERLPSAFFSVSLAAHGDIDNAQSYVDEFEQETGWRPAKVALFGGALLYTQYGFVKRHHEADRPRQARHLGTDTSRDYVYTEWDGVKRFVEDFLEGLVPNHVDDVRPAVSHRPDDAQPGPTSSTPAVTPTSPAPSNAAAST
jgi:hypothetical protein